MNGIRRLTLIIFSILAVCFASTVYAEVDTALEEDDIYAAGVVTGTTEDGWEYTEEFNVLYITGYEGQIEEGSTFTIPGSLMIDGEAKDVTGIGTYAFPGIAASEVIVQEGIKELGNQAFGSGRMNGISLPDSLMEIGDNAFYYCINLANITIPEGVTSIGNHTFYGCINLAGASLPDGLTYIGEQAFYGCISLTDIALPNGIKEIKSRAFSGCSRLTGITIPGGLRYIENNVFSGCSSLVSLTISEGVKGIESSAFSGCTSLPNVAIPDSVHAIREKAFYNCTELTSFTILSTSEMKGTISFGNMPFGYYGAVTGRDKMVPGFTIRGYTGSCVEQYALEKGIPFESVGVIPGLTPSPAPSITPTPTCTPTPAITPTPSPTRPPVLTRVTIAEWTSANSATITCRSSKDGWYYTGWTVKYDFEPSFDYTEEGIPVSAGEPFVVDIEGIDAEYGEDIVLYVQVMDTAGALSIKGTTVLLDSRRPGRITPTPTPTLTPVPIPALEDCEIILPKSINAIKENAFEATNIQSVYIPDGVIEISSGAFRNCRQLKYVYMPDSIQDISETAFIGCKNVAFVCNEGSEYLTEYADTYKIPIIYR